MPSHTSRRSPSCGSAESLRTREPDTSPAPRSAMTYGSLSFQLSPLGSIGERMHRQETRQVGSPKAIVTKAPVTQPEPFRVRVDAAVLADLQLRIGETRWADVADDDGWKLGTSPRFMRD